MSASPATNDNVFGERVLEQMYTLWINPEIEKRRGAGNLPEPFILYAAQVVMNVDAALQVRFNEEVKFIAEVRATRAIKKGEPISFNDFDKVIAVELTDEDADAGHITAIFRSEASFVTFNFRYNARRIQNTISAAEEFLSAAKAALEKRHLRPCYDLLFSAVELLSRSILLEFPDRQVLDGKTHGIIRSKINLRNRDNVAGGEFAGLLNELDKIRPTARYNADAAFLKDIEASEFVAKAERMLEFAKERAPKRVIAAKETGVA